MSDTQDSYTVDQSVQELWEQVVQTCNRVINQAEMHGFQLMALADPNVHEVSKMLDLIVCPLLDSLVKDAEFSPQSGMKMANIRQYNLHLREITLALDENCVDKFNTSVENLSREAMLI